MLLRIVSATRTAKDALLKRAARVAIDRQKLAAYARRIGKSAATARKWAKDGPPKAVIAKWKKQGPPKSVLRVPTTKTKPKTKPKSKSKVKAKPKTRKPLTKAQERTHTRAVAIEKRAQRAEERAERAERALAESRAQAKAEARQKSNEARKKARAAVKSAAQKIADERVKIQESLDADKWRKAELLLRHAVREGTLEYEWHVIAEVLGLPPQEVFERGYRIGGATVIGARKLWDRYELAERLVRRALREGTFETEYLRIARLTGMSAREVYTLGVSPPSLGTAA